MSGSGKSTLVHDVLCARLRRGRGGERGGPTVEGAEFVEELEVVDQSPLGRSPRSNPVTYMKAFDAIRQRFAETREAVVASGAQPAHTVDDGFGEPGRDQRGQVGAAG